jgi:CCR4-NOT transcription complex subunit 7/8
MPPLPRYQSGPNAISQYHQQFQSHGQHSSSHPPPMGGNPGYLNPNSGVNPFSANSNLLGLTGGLNTGGFNVGGESGLASHAARMGFHAGGLQQQQQQQQPHHQHAAHQQAQHAQHMQVGQQHLQGQQHGMAEHGSRAQSKGRIREVWKHNLEEEIAALRNLIDKYPFVAMVCVEPQRRAPMVRS